jgi:hypothetical protein
MSELSTSNSRRGVQHLNKRFSKESKIDVSKNETSARSKKKEAIQKGQPPPINNENQKSIN